MIKELSEETWSKFRQLLPSDRKPNEPVIPQGLTYHGSIYGPFDYVLPNNVLTGLRKWLRVRGETRIFYFLTESTPDVHTDFEIELIDLNEQSLSEVNDHFENILTGEDFSWALFVDHEGSIHVAGPRDLYLAIRNTYPAIKSQS